MDARKRRQPGGAPNTNGGFKKSKQETDSSGVGSKSKPCTKFFSTSGCSFGETCHYLHYVPGGYKAVAQMMNLPPMDRMGPPLPPQPLNGAAPAMKTRLCKRFSSAEGCKFGDSCNFAHGEWQLNTPAAMPFEHRHPMGPPMQGRAGLSAGFGESENANVKIAVESSMVGPIIGKSGVNSKQICRQTGVRLAIRDHESNPNMKNIELEGTFEQIKIATDMVRNLMNSVSASAKGHGGTGPAHGPGSNNYKTKLCENFTMGTCTFGDKCHFAHGESELRKSGV